MMISAFYHFFVQPMWAEIHGLEVVEWPGEEDLPPLEIPAWLSLDLHGGSELSIFPRLPLILVRTVIVVFKHATDFNIMCPWVLSSFAIPNIFWLNNSYFHFLPISCCKFSIFSNFWHQKWPGRPRPRPLALRFLYDGAMSLIQFRYF